MRFFRLIPLCGALLLAAGCAGYRLGPANGTHAGEKSIQIAVFSNQTLEPRLGDAVATALRRELQRDGTFHLATHGGADITVTGELVGYTRQELSFVPNDVLTVRDFRVNVTAHVTARETGTGKVIFDRPVSGYTFVRSGSDLTSAERQGLPLLADDLAKNITALLVDGNW